MYYMEIRSQETLKDDEQYNSLEGVSACASSYRLRIDIYMGAFHQLHNNAHLDCHWNTNTVINTEY
jgi:hypothetical protein